MPSRYEMRPYKPDRVSLSIFSLGPFAGLLRAVCTYITWYQGFASIIFTIENRQSGNTIRVNSLVEDFLEAWLSGSPEKMDSLCRGVIWRFSISSASKALLVTAGAWQSLMSSKGVFHCPSRMLPQFEQPSDRARRWSSPIRDQESG